MTRHTAGVHELPDRVTHWLFFIHILPMNGIVVFIKSLFILIVIIVLKCGVSWIMIVEELVYDNKKVILANGGGCGLVVVPGMCCVQHRKREIRYYYL